jgi:hypothetical protein
MRVTVRYQADCSESAQSGGLYTQVPTAEQIRMAGLPHPIGSSSARTPGSGHGGAKGDPTLERRTPKQIVNESSGWSAAKQPKRSTRGPPNSDVGAIPADCST